jgi:hypothetical protein
MHRVRTLLSLAASGVLAAAVAAAQDQPAPTLADLLKVVGESVRDAKRASLPPDIGVNTDFIKLVVLQRQNGLMQQLLEQFEEERHDEQVGATSSASGTTTVTSKGTVPKILAFAVENGAVTQTRSGTVLTFRTNIGGAIRAAAKQGFLQLHTGSDPSLDLLGRVALSASFDTSRGADATAPVLTADQQQLSQWTFRAQLVNRRDPGSPAFQTKWRREILPSQFNENRAAAAAHDRLKSDAAFQTWLNAANAALDLAPPQQVEAVLKRFAARFPVDELKPETKLAFEQYDQASSRFEAERRNLLAGLEEGALVTFEYTNDRPLKGPKLSNFRLIGEIGGTVDLTGNASLTIFDQLPIGASKRVRDVQLTGEMDMRLGSADTIPFVLAFSGKYVHQFENSIDATTGLTAPDTTGTTALGQVKLVIPAGKGTGMKIPVSLTVANRTELIKESIVRANVGITYDLDSLFARLKP